MKNLCCILDFCTTFGHREASIIVAGPPAEVAAAMCGVRDSAGLTGPVQRRSLSTGEPQQAHHRDTEITRVIPSSLQGMAWSASVLSVSRW